MLVCVPEDTTAFAGDMLFMDSHPIVWNGPVQAWIDACDLMMSRDVETVVPGHGPVTDKQGNQGPKDYLLFVRAEFRKCFDAGMAYEEASRDIDLGEFDDDLEEVDRIELPSAAGGYTIVENDVRTRRQSTHEAFIPFSNRRVEFGEAVIELRGWHKKVALFCLILPHSNVWFVMAKSVGVDGGQPPRRSRKEQVAPGSACCTARFTDSRDTRGTSRRTAAGLRRSS